MNDILYCHPETLRKLNAAAGLKGFNHFLDQWGLSHLRVITYRNLPKDQLIVPEDWLAPDAQPAASVPD